MTLPMPSGMRPVSEEIEAIVKASTMHEASMYRNAVAIAAMNGKRPESDADACRAAFFGRWSHELQRPALNIPPPVSGLWGD